MCLWMRNAERAEEVNTRHCNSVYLPGIDLNPGLRASADLSDAVNGCDVVFVAVPSKSCREVAPAVSPPVGAGYDGG